MNRYNVGRYWAVCLGVLSIASWAAAQSAATSELDSATILIGDQVTLKLHAGFPAANRSLGFDLSALDSVGKIEVIKVSPAASATAGQINQKVLITSFEEGKHTIPALLFTSENNGIVDSAYTDSLLLEVRTLPITSDTVQLQPIKPIIAEPKNLSDFAPFLALGTGLLALVLLLYFVFRKPKKDLKVYHRRAPQKPPHEIALEQLDALKEEALWQKGELKAYYSRLTHILRQYLEERFAVKALESTSDEIIANLNTLPIGEEIEAAVTKLLYAADLVKFAKAVPAEDTHERHWDNVRNLVLYTQPPTTPEVPETPKK